MAPWSFGGASILRIGGIGSALLPHLQSLPDLRLEPTTFGLQAGPSPVGWKVVTRAPGDLNWGAEASLKRRSGVRFPKASLANYGR